MNSFVRASSTFFCPFSIVTRIVTGNYVRENRVTCNCDLKKKDFKTITCNCKARLNCVTLPTYGYN